MMEGQEFHSSELLVHCRVCGDSLVKQRVTYPCIDHQDSLYRAFGINGRVDQPHTHPQRFCNRCLVAMKRMSLTTSLVPFKWEPHSTESACRVRMPPKCKVLKNIYIIFRFVSTSKATTRQVGLVRPGREGAGLAAVAGPFY